MAHLTNNNNIQNDKPTKKQLDFIADIQEFTETLFTGSTKSEASRCLYFTKNSCFQ